MELVWFVGAHRKLVWVGLMTPELRVLHSTQSVLLPGNFRKVHTLTFVAADWWSSFFWLFLL